MVCLQAPDWVTGSSRQPTIAKRGLAGRRNGMWSAGTRSQLWQCMETAIGIDALQHPLIVFECGASNVRRTPRTAICLNRTDSSSVIRSTLNLPKWRPERQRSRKGVRKE